MEIEHIRIGKIVNTQGNRGALRVFPLTDYPERFLNMTKVKVALEDQITEYHIEQASFHKKFVIIRFKEIRDMNQAMELKNGFLVVDREDLTPLPKDNYYIFQLIGMDVFDVCGDRLGALSEVIRTGANDVYVVETGAKPLLLPALKQVVLSIDVTKGRMVVKTPEGL